MASKLGMKGFIFIFMRLPASLNNVDSILLILRLTKQLCLEYVLCTWDQSICNHFSLQKKDKNVSLTFQSCN